MVGLLLAQADGGPLARVPTGDADAESPWIDIDAGSLAHVSAPVRPLPMEVPIVCDVRELACEHMRMLAARHGFLSDTVHAVLRFPGRAVESVVAVLLPSRIEVNSLVLFDQSQPGDQDLGDILLATFCRREMHFAAKYAVDVGDEAPDWDDFRRGQVRVGLDSLNRAFRERYNMPALNLDTVLSAFRSGDVFEWILVPALSVAYVLRFGIDRKFEIGDYVDVNIQIERPTRILRAFRHGGQRQIGSLSFRFFEFPVMFIGTLDVRDGGCELGFVGFGTDLATVNNALEVEDEP